MQKIYRFLPKKSFLLASLCLLALLLVTLFNPGSAAAQTKSFYWERFDVDITLLENGDMQIVETQVLNFSGEPFSFG